MMMKRTLVAVAAVILAIVTVGCSSKAPGLVRAGHVTLEKVGAKGVDIMWAEVRQDGEYAVINGSLVPKGAAGWRRVGHVDVELTDAQGQTVALACSEPIYVTLRGPGRGTKIKRFEVRTPANVPADGKAQVTFNYGAECEPNAG